MLGRRTTTGALIVAACVASCASAEITIRDPGTFVVDQAGIINANDERSIEAWLRALEQKTGAQVKVLTVDTTGGEDPFDFGFRHAQMWKLGQKGKDNGALIVLAVKERNVKFHVGYGLEGDLPDSWCGSACRKVRDAYFKKGQYSEGLKELSLLAANTVAEKSNVQLGGMPAARYGQDVQRMAQHSRGRRKQAFCGAMMGPLFFILILISVMSRRRRYYGRWGGGGLLQGLFWGSVMSNMLGGGGRSGWGGGGFGGGFGGGGFGGFGGGSFGGGGTFGGGGGGASW